MEELQIMGMREIKSLLSVKGFLHKVEIGYLGNHMEHIHVKIHIMPPCFLDTPEDFDLFDNPFYGLAVPINLNIEADLLRAPWWLEGSDEVRITHITLVSKQVFSLKELIKQAMVCYSEIMNTALEGAFDPDYGGVEEGTDELIFDSMVLLLNTVILPFP
jgi:hypothetical protein